MKYKFFKGHSLWQLRLQLRIFFSSLCSTLIDQLKFWPLMALSSGRMYYASHMALLTNQASVLAMDAVPPSREITCLAIGFCVRLEWTCPCGMMEILHFILSPAQMDIPVASCGLSGAPALERGFLHRKLWKEAFKKDSDVSIHCYVPILFLT